MKKSERLPIDSDLLQTFVVIADCGNLTLAANRLGRTQSAISVQLRKLEDGLGASLFFRSVRGMALTPAGDALLTRAQSILFDIREAAELFLEPLKGTMRVGFPDDFDDSVLENILMNFSRTHPSVQVLARSGSTSGFPAAIKAGELDVAVCSGLEEPTGDRLASEPIVWAARDAARWRRSEPVDLAVLDRSCYWRDLPAAALQEAGREFRIAFQSSSFTSLKAAIRAGLAVGLLPKSSLSEDFYLLTETDGFPRLPVSHRSIKRAAQAPEEITEAMVQAIKSACHNQADRGEYEHPRFA